jgi:hypothetical protein
MCDTLGVSHSGSVTLWECHSYFWHSGSVTLWECHSYFWHSGETRFSFAHTKHDKPKTLQYSQTNNFGTAAPIRMIFWPRDYLSYISGYQVFEGAHGEWRLRTSNARRSRPHCRGNQAPNWDSTERYVPNALIPAHLSQKMLKIREVAVTHHIYQNCKKLQIDWPAPAKDDRHRDRRITEAHEHNRRAATTSFFCCASCFLSSCLFLFFPFILSVCWFICPTSIADRLISRLIVRDFLHLQC